MSEESVAKKKDLRDKMMELHKQHRDLNNELKDLEELERREASHALFADYKFKIGVFGHLYDEEQITEVSNQDREEASVGRAGFVYTNSEHRDGYYCIMLKEKEEYARLKLLFVRLSAADKIQSKEEKDKEKYVKILLGEAE